MAAHADHAHAHEARHCAGRVARGGLHCIGGCVRHPSRHCKGVGADVHRVLDFVDLLHVRIGQRDGIERDFRNGNAAVFDPFLFQCVVHCRLKLVCLCGNLCRAQLLFGKRTERGLKRIDKFDLELSVYLIARELRCNVAAKP